MTATKKTMDDITRDVKADWGRPKDQATIRRRWPRLSNPLEIQTAEMRQRWFLQSLIEEREQRAAECRCGGLCDSDRGKTTQSHPSEAPPEFLR